MQFLKKAATAALILSVLTACSDSATMIVPQGVIPRVDHSEKPKDLQYFSPKVDILFVIDNSASMQPAQDNLRLNAYKFADALSKMAILDFHVGVITTDARACNIDCGRLRGVPAFIDKTTPNMVTTLSEKMMVGTDGDVTEMMFTPVVQSMAAMMEAGPNKGFFRPDAYLAVIMITDAAEQSSISSPDFLQFLIQKKGDARRVLSYGVIRKLSEQNSCTTGGETLDAKLEDFLMSTVNGNINQDNVLSLCSVNFGEKLAEFAKDIVSRSAGSVKLTRLPNPNTIKVSYGTQVIPNALKNGWTYRPSSNTLEFGPEIEWTEQPDGTTLSIDFEVLETN